MVRILSAVKWENMKKLGAGLKCKWYKWICNIDWYDANFRRFNITHMQIEIIDPVPQADISLIKSSIELVFKGEHKIAEFVNVIFLQQTELRLLKKKYFDLDVFTDVIAFNLNDPHEAIEGEIYLSMEQIALNAIQYKTDPMEELYRVLIHGCLHLCGYEDEISEQKAQMTSLEDRYLAGIGTWGAA
jgi:rRNA maturation RNase YbeY